MKRPRPSRRVRRTPRPPVVRSDQLGTALWAIVQPYLQPLTQRGSESVGHGLLWLSANPRRRQGAIASLVVVMLGWSAWSLFSAPLSASSYATPPEAMVIQSDATAVPASSVSDADAVLVTVAGYNQASIAAGQSIRADIVQPFLAEDGRTWQEVRTEFTRRVRRGETTDAELVRWGVVDSQITGNTAVLTTKEVWNVITTVGGAVISSRSGTMIEATYTLRRASNGTNWLITDVTTIVLIA